MSNNGPQAAGSSGWIELFPNDWIAEPPDGQGLVESDISTSHQGSRSSNEGFEPQDQAPLGPTSPYPWGLSSHLDSQGTPWLQDPMLKSPGNCIGEGTTSYLMEPSVKSHGPRLSEELQHCNHASSNISFGSQSTDARRGQDTRLGSSLIQSTLLQVDQLGLPPEQACLSYREWPEGQPSRVDFQHSQPSNALVTSEAHQAGPSSLDQGKGLGRPVTAPTDPDTSDFRQSAKQLDAWLGNIQMEVDPLVVPRADANPLPADVPIFDLLSQGPPTIPFPPSTPTYAPFVATLSSEYRGHEASSFSTSPTDANTGSSRRGVAFIPLARSVSVTPSSTLCVSPGSFADSPFESQHIFVVDSGPESLFMSPPNHHTRVEAESFPQEMLGMLREGAKLARQFNNSRSPHPGFAPTPMTDPDGQDNSTTLGDNNSDDEPSDDSPHRTPLQKCQYCREWHTNLRRHHRSTCKSPQNPKQKHSAECLICGGTEGQNRARHKKTKRHVAATRRAEGGFGIIVSVR